jgi:hypothetical protein
MNKVGIFLVLMLFISLLLLGYVLFMQKSAFTESKIDLITDEIILDRTFNINKTISDIIKRKKLTLTNTENTLIITWQMNLPNIGGEFYWTSNYNKDKPIIRIGKSPHIYYNAKQNKLKVLTKYQYSPFINHFPLIELENINLQSWNTYTIVIKNYSVKIYVNGELVLSKKLENSIIIDDYKTNELLVGEINNNLLGKIRNFSIYLNELSHEQLQVLNI